MSLAVPVLARMLETRESVEKVIAGWKMSTAEANQLRWTFDNRHFVQTEREWKAALVNGLDRQWVLDLLEMQAKNYTYYEQSETLGLRARLRDWELPVFPVNGNDLLVRGYQGKEVGDLLRELRAMWVESDYTDTRDELLYEVDTRQ